MMLTVTLYCKYMIFYDDSSSTTLPESLNEHVVLTPLSVTVYIFYGTDFIVFSIKNVALHSGRSDFPVLPLCP